MNDTEHDDPIRDPRPDLIRRHLLLAWGGLALFIVLGAVLEGLHAFKSPFYLDVENETRRLMFRLAHAHGALLSLLQMGVAHTLGWLAPKGPPRRAGFVSLCFTMALVLLPVGFFLAGLGAKDGDPGWGIALVPGGAIFLLAGVGSLSTAVWRAR